MKLRFSLLWPIADFTAFEKTRAYIRNAKENERKKRKQKNCQLERKERKESPARKKGKKEDHMHCTPRVENSILISLLMMPSRLCIPSSFPIVISNYVICK